MSHVTAPSTGAGCARSVSCSINNNVPSCNTDSQFAGVISTLRAAVPRPLILSLAAYSIGAYGWGNYVTAQPVGSHTGAPQERCRTTMQRGG